MLVIFLIYHSCSFRIIKNFLAKEAKTCVDGGALSACLPICHLQSVCQSCTMRKSQWGIIIEVIWYLKYLPFVKCLSNLHNEKIKLRIFDIWNIWNICHLQSVCQSCTIKKSQWGIIIEDIWYLKYLPFSKFLSK